MQQGNRLSFRFHHPLPSRLSVRPPMTDEIGSQLLLLYENTFYCALKYIHRDHFSLPVEARHGSHGAIDKEAQELAGHSDPSGSPETGSCTYPPPGSSNAPAEGRSYNSGPGRRCFASAPLPTRTAPMRGVGYNRASCSAKIPMLSFRV